MSKVTNQMGGGVGSNQYQVRGTKKAIPSPNLDLPPIDPIGTPYDSQIVPEILQADVRSGDWNRMLKVATNRHTPAEVLQELADTHRELLFAGLQKAQSGILMKRQWYALEQIPRWIAAHRNCPVLTLSNLVTHSDPVVRRRVAANLHTPVEVAISMLKDSDRIVRRKVLQRADMPDHIKAISILSN